MRLLVGFWSVILDDSELVESTHYNSWINPIEPAAAAVSYADMLSTAADAHKDVISPLPPGYLSRGRRARSSADRYGNSKLVPLPNVTS